MARVRYKVRSSTTLTTPISYLNYQMSLPNIAKFFNSDTQGHFSVPKSYLIFLKMILILTFSDDFDLKVIWKCAQFLSALLMISGQICTFAWMSNLKFRSWSDSTPPPRVST